MKPCSNSQNCGQAVATLLQSVARERDCTEALETRRHRPTSQTRKTCRCCGVLSSSDSYLCRRKAHGTCASGKTESPCTFRSSSRLQTRKVNDRRSSLATFSDTAHQYLQDSHDFSRLRGFLTCIRLHRSQPASTTTSTPMTLPSSLQAMTGYQPFSKDSTSSNCGPTRTSCPSTQTRL